MYNVLPGATMSANSTTYVDFIYNTQYYRHSILYDSSKFDSPEVYLVAWMRSRTSNNTTICLFEMDDDVADGAGTEISATALTSSSTTEAWYTTANIASYLTSGKRYKVKLKNDSTASLDSVLFACYIVVKSTSTTALNFTKRETDLTMSGGNFNVAYTSYQTNNNTGRYHKTYLHDAAAWNGTLNVYLEATLASSNASGTAYVDLYDATDTVEVTGSEISISGTTVTRVRSSAITLTDGHIYYVRFKTNNASYNCRAHQTRLIFQQTAPVDGNIYKTRTFLDLNARSSGTSSTYTSTYKYAMYTNTDFGTISAIYHDVCGQMSATATGYLSLLRHGSTILTGSEMTVTAYTFSERWRSSAVSPSTGNEYTLQYKSDATNTIYTDASMMIIDSLMAQTQHIHLTSDSQFASSGPTTREITKLSDSRSIKTQETTSSSNSRFIKTQETTKSSDTRIKKLAQEFTKLSDSRTRKTYDIGKTSDSRYRKTQSLTPLSDTRFRKTIDTTKLSDSRARKTIDITKLSDNIFRKTQTLTKFSDAKVWVGTININKFVDSRYRKTQETTKPADSRFRKTTDINKSSDERLKKTQTITKYSDTNIWVGTQTKTKTSDSRYRRTYDITKYSDTLLWGAGTIIKLSDTRIRKTLDITKNSDSRYRITQSLTKLSDTKFKKTIDVSKTSDQRFRKTQEQTKTSDSRFRKTYNKVIRHKV
jgi:hypothetical protein